MINMLKSIKTSHTIAALGGTYVGYYSLWLQLQDRKKIDIQTKLDVAMQEINKLSSQMEELQNKNISLTQEKLNMLEFYKTQIRETSVIVEELKVKLENYKTLFENNTPVSQDEVVDTVENMVDQINTSNTIVEKAMELWHGSANKL